MTSGYLEEPSAGIATAVRKAARERTIKDVMEGILKMSDWAECPGREWMLGWLVLLFGSLERGDSMLRSR
jgi:hypothetical protein